MAKIISITEAKKNLLKLSRRGQEHGESFLIIRDLKLVSVLTPFDEYESLLETLNILEEDPDIRKKLVATEKEVAKGEFTEWRPPERRKKRA